MVRNTIRVRAVPHVARGASASSLPERVRGSRLFGQLHGRKGATLRPGPACGLRRFGLNRQAQLPPVREEGCIDSISLKIELLHGLESSDTPFLRNSFTTINNPLSLLISITQFTIKYLLLLQPIENLN